MRQITTSLLSIATLCLSAQSFQSLRTHPFEIDADKPEALEWLSEDLNRYNFICTSEFHRTELAIAQYKQFISFLLDNGGLDKLVMERPYAYGVWLTRYLETGDETYLKVATDRFWSFDKFRKEDKVAHDAYGLFNWLYAMLIENNKSLEVVVIDLDENRHASLELWSMLHFIEKYQLHDHFPGSTPTLHEMVTKEDENSIASLKKWMKHFETEYSLKREVISNSMGADFELFDRIVQSLRDVCEYGNGNSQSSRDYREAVMLRNFRREVAPTDRVYAQFGFGHIATAPLSNKYTGFMAMLQDDAPYAGRTLAINIHCIACRVSTIPDAYIPYRQKEDGNYYYSDAAYSIADGDLRHALFKHVSNQSTAIDVRTAEGALKDLENQFQWMILLF
ncbi:MAG: hypothetical protein RLP12_11700 [Ekhidna sp.]